MKLIAEKYRTIKPTIDHLADEVIIAQAWKKTHAYMRTHNWYADTLALDVSALGLESNAKSWAETIRSSKEKLYSMELIPAAKSEKWVVDATDGWVPNSLLDEESNKARKDKPPLRPLAHLSVRDQTWASAVMLCLADAVETAQGDCSEINYFKAQHNKVYSYGNRLLCDWTDDSAWFRWGNSEVYRKFFTDYQNFLRRPVAIGRSVTEGQGEENHLYVISLDISKFYDHIDTKLLIERLKEIAGPHYDIKHCSDFWSSVEKVIDWQWTDDALNRAKSLNIELGKGLPQGLVASGFFANAYLIDFDKVIGGKIGDRVPKATGVTLHDYSRYVDDLRLVVSTEDDVDIKKLNDDIYTWVSEKLTKFGGENLTLNQQKTQVTALSDLDNSGSLSERVANLQNELSGPTDRESLESVMGVLEGLLTLQSDVLPESISNQKDNALLRLAKFDHDVRPDTLKRFAANRLESVMRNKRKVTVDERSTGKSGASPIDNESELLAKKLLWAWMQDPSLALVLRKALEIYPSPTIAEPVFDSLYSRSSLNDSTVDLITQATADYLLADLFRSCVDFHGFFQRIDYPESSDPQGLLRLAARYAQKAIATDKLPDFVERQALLLLAVMQKPIHQSNNASSIQLSLHAILSGTPIKLKRQNLALYEVAAQISGDYDAVAAQLVEHMMESVESNLSSRVLVEFSQRGGDFWLSLWRRLFKNKEHRPLLDDFKWGAPVVGGDPRPVQQRLSKIVASNNNGFIHEVAQVKLALSLINEFKKEKLEVGLSPSQINVSQQQSNKKPWGELWKPDIELKCESKNKSSNDPRFITPKWINEEIADAKLIYWIGTILRSAALGGSDFTSNRWKKSTVDGYKGLRTGWFKRRMGMMHTPESLVGEFSTMTDWGAELLMKCLQWPGFESTHIQDQDIAAIDDVETLECALNKRLATLNALYCEASDMPALLTSVKRPMTGSIPDFRLVTVQPLLPRTSDFTASDPCLNSPDAKRKNRDHLASLCQLTYKTLMTKLQADGEKCRPCADLIVLPEVAVHPDDLDILKRLADKTRSMILAGLVFTDHDGKLINIARWLIPDYRDSGRQWTVRDQGKAFPTSREKSIGVVPERPCQHIIEINGIDAGPFKISGAICYDATDLKLASDLRDKTDLFVILAHNKDINTFDTMASALNYHMYQHVALVNKGEFGGSTIQAPYKQQYDRLISHSHGVGQISINVADLDLAAFNRKTVKKRKEVKTKPAGM